MEIKIIDVNYNNDNQAKELVYLLNAYASDPMGGGNPLKQFTVENLVIELSKRPYAFSVISYVDSKPAGLINCFEAFSTFLCKPLVNIHDVIVLEKFRGKGISQKMLERVEEIAVTKGCCKLTLEVLSENKAAKSSYEKYGFNGYELAPKAGSALFWQKII